MGVTVVSPYYLEYLGGVDHREMDPLIAQVQQLPEIEDSVSELFGQLKEQLSSIPSAFDDSVLPLVQALRLNCLRAEIWLTSAGAPPMKQAQAILKRGTRVYHHAKYG